MLSVGTLQDSVVLERALCWCLDSFTKPQSVACSAQDACVHHQPLL